MLKKVIPIILSLCLTFSVSVMAENANTENDNVPKASQEMPLAGERPSGGRGGMGMPPMGDIEESTSPQTDGNSSGENSQLPGGNPQFSGQRPEGMGGFTNMQNNNQNTQTEKETGFIGFVKTYSTPITSVVLLIFAYIFVLFYKRKHY